jgi:uncharacterized protein HemX
MSKFDDELKLALRREEPSPGFTDRVMARIQAMEQLPVAQEQEKQREKNRRRDEQTEGPRDWWRKIALVLRPPQLRWAMAAAMAAVLFAAAFGVVRYREHQRQMAEIAAQAEGQRAKEQVMLAMRIASAKLNAAQRKVKEASERDEGHPEAKHQPN